MLLLKFFFGFWKFSNQLNFVSDSLSYSEEKVNKNQTGSKHIIQYFSYQLMSQKCSFPFKY